jgi:hypothetical protein
MFRVSSDRARSTARLGVAIGVLILGLATPRAVTPSSGPASSAGEGSGDAALFRSVVERMRQGAGYYPAMNDMLRRMRYPTASVLNWRTPALYQFLAMFPTWQQARLLLIFLAVAACAGAIVVGVASSVPAFVVIALNAVGVVLIMSAPGEVGMAESWAGCLIGLSICAYRFNLNVSGALLGGIALFVRELAVPFVAICGLVALRRRRWVEVAVWTAVAVAYVVYYGVHWGHVATQQMPDDIRHARSWIAWGGLGFLLSVVNWQGILMLAPWFLTVVSLMLIAAGILSPGAPEHVRLTAAVYSTLFLMVGQTFNEYWGVLLWPTWLIAEGVGAHALISDVRTVVR